MENDGKTQRARTYVDQQLAQLEKQLVAISNYLDGSSSSMFPSHILVKVNDAPAIAAASAICADGVAAGKGGAAPPGGKLAAAPTANTLQSVAFLVEDDLASGMCNDCADLQKHVLTGRKAFLSTGD